MTTETGGKRLTIDASAVVGLLLDGGAQGDWVADQIHGATLVAPELLPFEVANVLRRHAAAGLIDPTAAHLAHDDLTRLPVTLYPYAALAERIWSLRENYTAYDAAYVALAEALQSPLVTLDARLSRSPSTDAVIRTYAPTDEIPRPR